MTAPLKAAETFGGFLMLGAAAVALVAANVRGGLLHSLEPLEIWVNDGLMSVFFLAVGLEIKREICFGALSSTRRLMLPVICALGGMLVPAAIFFGITHAGDASDPAAARGWAVPCATDIAFSLAIVRLLGERCPLSLRVLLTAIAVVDDLGAIVLIALFYGTSIQVEMLAAAAVCFAVLVALNRLGLKTLPLYLIAGALLWYCVFRSGIHPTIAGVLTAATIPMRGEQGRDQSAGHWLETFLQPWVVFIILPLFALLNAGVSIAGLQGQDLVAPVTLGVALGLVAGKTVGIAAGCLLAVRAGWAHAPERCTALQVIAMAALCGIGFTMSLFIAGLAYGTAQPQLYVEAKVGLLGGSLIAALLGSALMRMAPRSVEPA